MKENPFNKFDNPSEYLLPGEKEGDFIENVASRIKQQSKPASIIPLKWIFGIAATVLLFSTIFFLKPTNTMQLAERNFAPYKNYKVEQTRGTNIDIQAYSYYDNAEFESAIIEFEKMENISGLDALYYAISLQGTGDWQTARDALKSAKKEIPLAHEDAWTWHYILNLVALESKEEAISELDKLIASGQSQFLDQATKIKKKLN